MGIFWFGCNSSRSRRTTCGSHGSRTTSTILVDTVEVRYVAELVFVHGMMIKDCFGLRQDTFIREEVVPGMVGRGSSAT